MLRRRISKHIGDQNWIAVIIDFAIVVVGVFMGIQLGNWNEARGDRAAEISYLMRYHEDLSATLDMFAVRLRLIDQQLDEIPNAMARPSDSEQAWKTIRAQYVISGFTPPEIRTATYTDMVSSGRLELIADQSLRANLVGHYSRNGALPVLTNEPPFREMVRGVIPHEMQDYLTSPVCLADFETYLTCPAPDQAEGLDEIAMILISDVELSRALNFNIAHHKISRNIITSIVAQTHELREIVAAALEDKGVEL
ncbi:MAG: DUF6090 family protein [Pseudomonadota bacterium]